MIIRTSNAVKLSSFLIIPHSLINRRCMEQYARIVIAETQRFINMFSRCVYVLIFELSPRKRVRG